MPKRKCAAVVLAAGLGTRMKSNKAKVLHEMAGLPMVCYCVRTAFKCKFSPIVVVVGHQGDLVEKVLREFLPKADLRFVTQKQQLGTGHAMKMAKPALKDFKGDVAILYGDVPLLRSKTLLEFFRVHTQSKLQGSVMSLFLDNPDGYGRMQLDKDQNLVKIVEEKDADEQQKKIQEVNSGIYIVDCKALFSKLNGLKKNNAQGEYYLTDAISKLAKQTPVGVILLENPIELTGINNRSDLALVTAALQEQINEYWMRQGVTLLDPASTYIDAQTIIGIDTTVAPNVCLRGKTKIGTGCLIEAGSFIKDAVIKNDVTVLPYSVIEGSTVGTGCQIGPFARIRPGTKVGEDCKVGNFVEMKKVTTGKNTKISHLAYMGDAKLGDNINVGAGTITCNYDGVNKFTTTIADGVFIGSDSQLIAPVKVGKRAYIASGSTITEDVPADALAVSRADQKNIKGAAKRIAKRNRAIKKAGKK
jgi:bifunctional UDP-N-acetylglucosamine pyrophosphorylase/glucosamine-1-phosphate N-acetyltransferase